MASKTPLNYWTGLSVGLAADEDGHELQERHRKDSWRAFLPTKHLYKPRRTVGDSQTHGFGDFPKLPLYPFRFTAACSGAE